jgi:broad specificity phosphatase PhoE
VYVLRHPETTWNLAQRYQGRLESPLSAEGSLQARLVARAFSGAGLDVVYSSPLQRALCLAREIAEAADAPLHIDQRLTEIGQGAWEGLHLAEIQRRYPELYEAWYIRPDTVQMPGGETLHDVKGRALSVLATLFKRHSSGHVAVVTHSVIIQVLVACSLSLELRHIHRIRVHNCSITTLCGTELPGSLLALNVTDPLYHGPVANATAQDCVSWKGRRVTQ